MIILLLIEVPLEEIEAVKRNDHFGAIAEKNVWNCASLSSNELDFIFYVLDNTIQVNPAKRKLAKASAALKGQK